MACGVSAGKRLTIGDRFDCPCCSGDGCKECLGGKVYITEPPKVSSELWEVIDFCCLMDKGHAPVPGGALRQSKWFLDAFIFVTSEWKRLEAESWEK